MELKEALIAIIVSFLIVGFMSSKATNAEILNYHETGEVAAPSIMKHYTGNVKWDSVSGTVTFTSSGKINFGKTC